MKSAIAQKQPRQSSPVNLFCGKIKDAKDFAKPLTSKHLHGSDSLRSNVKYLMAQRKTGNGTSNRQWLYLYVNVPMVVLVKIGISGNYKRRAKQVAKSSFGWTIPVFAVKIPFAWQIEQAMHRLFNWFNIPYGGSKEWFLFPVAPVALAIMLLALVLEWVIFALVAMLFFWWMHQSA
jgi:T5orf172 domain